MRTNYNKIRDDAGKKPEATNETEIQKEPNEVKIPKEPIYALVANCDRLNVRESDNKYSKILCILNKGDKVMISPIYNVDIDDNWAHIQIEDGSYGYVMGEYIKEV